MTIAQPLRVLITGANGQLAQSFRWLQKEALEQGIELYFADRHALDIGNVDNISAFLDATPVDALVNTAAYTAVDKAESDGEPAELVNAVAPGLLAHACRQRGIYMLHVSTDYVFDGEKVEPYNASDMVNPLSVYGKTKLAGELAVLNEDSKAVVLRTSWVFSQFGGNFLKTMLRLGAERSELNIVNDQFGGPTYAPHIARLLLKMIDRHFDSGGVPGGVYHFAGTPHTSWYGFACDIFEQARQLGLLAQAPMLLGISSSSYPTPARRPINSRLSNARVDQLLGGSDCSWQRGVYESLTHIKNN